MKKTKRGRVMNDTKKTQEISIETLTVWADANQRVLRELAELSAATTKEGVRLYAELQQSGIEAFRGLLTEGVGSPEKWFRLLEGNAQAVTRTAERLSTTAEQTAKGIQQSFTEAVTKVKEAYTA